MTKALRFAAIRFAVLASSVVLAAGICAPGTAAADDGDSRGALVGHFMFIERNSDQVAKVVLDWINHLEQDR